MAATGPASKLGCVGSSAPPAYVVKTRLLPAHEQPYFLFETNDEESWLDSATSCRHVIMLMGTTSSSTSMGCKIAALNV